MKTSNDQAVFTRLEYLAYAHLHLTPAEVGLTRFGHLLDLIECWRQEQGLAKPWREIFIDDVIPVGI